MCLCARRKRTETSEPAPSTDQSRIPKYVDSKTAKHKLRERIRRIPTPESATKERNASSTFRLLGLLVHLGHGSTVLSAEALSLRHPKTLGVRTCSRHSPSNGTKTCHIRRLRSQESRRFRHGTGVVYQHIGFAFARSFL